MAVCDCMARAKDQTISLAFECTGVVTENRVIIGMASVVEFVIDVNGDLDLHEDIDHVEGISSDMETHKVIGSKQMICTSTDDKASEVELP